MPATLRPGVVLFDFYRTLLDIWTDEHDPGVWDKLARYLRYRGCDGEAHRLHDRYFSLIQTSLETSEEAHPEVRVAEVFLDILREEGMGQANLEEAVRAVQLFRVLSVRHFDLFPDVLPCLERLRRRGTRLGLVTDAQRVFLEPELRLSGLKGMMDVIVVSSDQGFHKPDGRMIATALDDLDASPDEAIFVGDSRFRDIGAARAAGVTAVLLDRDGNALGEEGAQPDLVVSNLDELCDRLGA